MAKFRKKPVVVEAFRLGDECPDWWADAVSTKTAIAIKVDGQIYGGPDYVLITTLEGVLRAEYGDWIVRGIKNEIYSVKDEIFAATYDEVVP